MYNEILLNDFAHQAINRFIFTKSCYLATGTGAILKHQDKFYIITCRHLADYFFEQENEKILFKNNSSIDKSSVKYLNRTTEEIDIAIIEILDDNIDSEFFELDSFEFLDDFTQQDFSKSNFFLLGHPYDLSYKKENERVILYLSYMTLPKRDKNPTKDYLYLDYRRDYESNRIIQKDLISRLPSPKGMSGALVFQVKILNGEENKIWTPDIFKAIAIQSSWNEKEGYIKCTSIKYIEKLLSMGTK